VQDREARIDVDPLDVERRLERDRRARTVDRDAVGDRVARTGQHDVELERVRLAALDDRAAHRTP